MPSSLINLKYKKYHKNPLKGKEYKKRLLILKNGILGIKVLENARLSIEQLESFSFSIKRLLKTFEKYSLNINANITLTQKLGDVRMGKGKGSVLGFIIRVHAGLILFEINCYRKNYDKLISNLTRYLKKLPIKCRIVKY
jgi:large subunit ribosomal protein L16